MWAAHRIIMKKHDIERIDKLQRTVTSLSMRVDTLAVRLDQLQRTQQAKDPSDPNQKTTNSV
jgi:hypothetical protein